MYIDDQISNVGFKKALFNDKVASLLGAIFLCPQLVAVSPEHLVWAGGKRVMAFDGRSTSAGPCVHLANGSWE